MLGSMGMGSPPDLTMLGASMVLVLLRIIDRPEAYQGFSDPVKLSLGTLSALSAPSAPYLLLLSVDFRDP